MGKKASDQALKDSNSGYILSNHSHFTKPLTVYKTTQFTKPLIYSQITHILSNHSYTLKTLTYSQTKHVSFQIHSDHNVDQISTKITETNADMFENMPSPISHGTLQYLNKSWEVKEHPAVIK